MLFALSPGEIATVVLGVVLAVSTLTATVAKFRNLPPVRWLITQLITQPVGEALDRHIDERVVVAVQEIRNDVQALSELTKAVHYEMHPNSGQSMRDVLDRVEGTSIHTQGQVDELKEDVSDLRDRTARMEGSIEVLRER